MTVMGPAKDLILVLQDTLEVAAASLDPVPARAVISPGSVATWDECHAGMAWIRLTALSTAGGRPPTGVGPAFSDIGLELGIIRCESTLDEVGNPPTPEQVFEDSTQQIADMLNLRNSLGALPGFYLDQWLPVGPQGGCVGGKWLLHSRLVHSGWKESV